MYKVGKGPKHSNSQSLPLLRHCRDPRVVAFSQNYKKKIRSPVIINTHIIVYGEGLLNCHLFCQSKDLISKCKLVYVSRDNASSG